MKNIIEQFDEILENNVVTFISKDKTGFLVGLVDKDEYENNKDYQQKHYTGDSLQAALTEALEDANSFRRWLNLGS